MIAALVLAAAYVYKIKFESTRQAQRVAKLRLEIRREHDAIAALRAEWAKLDSPARIQELAQAASRAEADRRARNSTGSTICRERPADLVPRDEPDPIGVVLANPGPDRPHADRQLPPKQKPLPPVANASPPVARR